MTVEQDFLAVLAEDLGPAAKTFLLRQCRNHLNKEPSMLQESDIDELAKWCQIGVQSALGAQIAESVKKGLLTLRQKP
jgi:hypothetical protein